MQVDLSVFQAMVKLFSTTVAAGGTSAAERYQHFHDFDPFEQIQPALLNSGHVASYAIATGMIEPFDLEQLTKPATYLVQVEGECRYRDEKGGLVSFYLSKDPAARNEHLDVRSSVRLAPNSVCFLTLAPEFRLPAYIGARFNLLIRDVYRGLLVGTGPLVDPGFTGRLSIPIHNFTNREYFIDAGEGLVYFEFTKLSWSNPTSVRSPPPWLPKPIDAQPPFPSSKARRKTLDDYLAAATGGGPPASSIGETMRDLKQQVDKTSLFLGIFSVGGVVAAAALVLTAWSLYSSAQQFAAASQAELRQGREKIIEQLDILEDRQNSLIRQLENEKEIKDRRALEVKLPENPAPLGKARAK